MLSYYSDAPVDGAFPSGTPSTAFTQQNQTAQDPRVAGAQTQNQQMQPPPTSDLNPPSPKPSPSAKPSPSPSAEPTATPSPSPSPSPSPTPTQEPNHNPTPTPTPTPDKPSPKAEAVCDGEKKPNIIVSWSGVTHAASYKVTRDGTEVSTDQSGTSYIDKTVTSGTTYNYKVKSKNSTGESPDSDPATSTALTCS